MNIAFFVSSFPLISETFILNQVTGLIDRGHNVDIYAQAIDTQEVNHPDVDKYELLKRTYCQGDSYALMPKNKLLRFKKAIEIFPKCFRGNSKIVLNSLNIKKYGTEAASLRLFFKASSFLNKKDKYDVIHCHFGPNGNSAAFLKSIGAVESKIVTTFHGYDITSYIKRHGRGAYKMLFETGDLFLPISERWKNELIQLGCDPTKIKIHRMGIDTKAFTPRPPSLNGRSVNLLSVGRLVEKKGIYFGIKAVALVLRKKPDLGIRYSIAGDGPLRGELESLIRELGINDKVSLLGWKKQDEIAQLMQGADILLAPSVTDAAGNMEGIPVVLMEALAQGIPVLTTQHSGIPELVANGVSGYLVPERDVDALAQRLEKMIDHQEEWPVLGQQGRRFVEEKFDINKLNDLLIDNFNKIIGVSH